MLILHRSGNVVKSNDGKILPINHQRSKGPNQEYVKIEGLEGSNGRIWLKLGLIEQGKNELTMTTSVRGQGKTPKRQYELTLEESNQVKKLQSEIDEIIENAKSRYIPRPEIKQTINMTNEELTNYINNWESYLEQLKNKKS